MELKGKKKIQFNIPSSIQYQILNQLNEYFKLSFERIPICCYLIFLAFDALFKLRNKRKIRLIVFPPIQYPLFYQSNKIFLLKRIRECIDLFSGFVTLLKHKNKKKIRITFIRQCNIQFSFDQIKWFSFVPL